MATALQFDLVTPEKHAFSDEVTMVEIPGEMGDFGVLAGHSPFLSKIRPGIVTIHRGESKKERLFITAGYAEVNPSGCTVLAEKSENVADVTIEDAAKRCDLAQKEMDAAVDDNARIKQQRLLTEAQALKASLESL